MKLKLPEGAFKAYLFDCDGTIVDSMPQHYLAWKKALAEWNCVFDEDLFYEWGGMPVAEIIARLGEMQGLTIPLELATTRKEELYYENLPELKPVAEVLEHIEASYGTIPFAVVSGSTRESVISSLEAVKLLDRFETMVCAGEYKRGKPDPEPFLMAAEKLGVAPADCLVFEDAEMGIRAAMAAGMASVKVEDPRVRLVAR